MPNQDIRFVINATTSISVAFMLTGIGLIKTLHSIGVGCGLTDRGNKVKELWWIRESV